VWTIWWCIYKLMYFTAVCIYTTKSSTPAISLFFLGPNLVVVYIFGVPTIKLGTGAGDRSGELRVLAVCIFLLTLHAHCMTLHFCFICFLELVIFIMPTVFADLRNLCRKHGICHFTCSSYSFNIFVTFRGGAGGAGSGFSQKRNKYVKYM